MREAFVLMTALPPTKGHLDLLRFTDSLEDVYGRTVLVCTQPGEPFIEERVEAISEALRNEGIHMNVVHFAEKIQQEPGEDPSSFWKMWEDILRSYGFQEGDYLVSSEVYGHEMAEAIGGVFMPYDLGRVINYTKATEIRKWPTEFQSYILPEFLKKIQKTITIFGAESVGKTATTHVLGDIYDATILPEWARPYLETVGPEVTTEKMNRIYSGQKALQLSARRKKDTRGLYIFQDTDLFSTVGYWEMWDRDSMPAEILEDAHRLKSDLYVILSSDIPFEPDPLRYGGAVRESSDQYWIDLCEREGLPYVYVTDTISRATTVSDIVEETFGRNKLAYQRVGKEYS